MKTPTYLSRVGHGSAGAAWGVGRTSGGLARGVGHGTLDAARGVGHGGGSIVRGVGHGTLGAARSVRSCCLFGAILFLLLVVGACAAITTGLARVLAAPAEPQGLDVVLVLDQSQSLYELGGTGSDPDLLRMDGARLFAAYLGVDGSLPDYRLAGVYFGTKAKLVLPLTSVISAAGRQLALDSLVQPEPSGWTDVKAALELAEQELFAGERAMPGQRTAIVLFTDGRPEVESFGTAGTEAAYLADLRALVGRLAGRGTAIFALLLHSPATDSDPSLAPLHRPFWIDLAETVPGVRFYDVRQAEDLSAIYHDIVVDLHGWQSQAPVLRQDLSTTASVALPIPTGWEQFTLLVHKSDPAIAVTLVDPTGVPRTGSEPDVSVTRKDASSQAEVWTVRRPRPGAWKMNLLGQGAVTAWLDYVSQPLTPTHTTTPSASATAITTPTHTPTVTPTRAPIGAPVAGMTQSTGGTGTPAHPRWVRLASLAALTGLAATVLLMTSGMALRRTRAADLAVDGTLRQIGLDGPTARPRRWELSSPVRAQVTLGRAAGCDVVLDEHAEVPLHAARIDARRMADGAIEVVLIAVDPEHPLFVNERRTSAPAALCHGDVIRIGPTRLRYENVLRPRQTAALGHRTAKR